MSNPFVTETGRVPLSAADREQFERYIAEIFRRLGMDTEAEACRQTPHRWLSALEEMTDGYNGDPNIEVVFKQECVNCEKDLPTVQIVEGPIAFSSLCEHHALPFIGRGYVGCLRHESIIGLSKFTRIIRKHARRFTVQERIAQGVANELEQILHPHGVIVWLHALHTCTQCRGVKDMGASTRTIEKRGAYVSNPDLVREFMCLSGIPPSATQ